MNGKKKVFISGPMSGIAEFNKPAFDQAETVLRACGFSVFNPSWMSFDLNAWSHEEIMAVDLAALSKCDYIYMLDGWQMSRGSKQEYNYAMAIGIPRLANPVDKRCINCKYHAYAAGEEPCKSCDIRTYSNWEWEPIKKCEPKSTNPAQQRIEIETWGDISGHNLKFLQWFEKYCNEILARGGVLTSDINTALDKSGKRSCTTCKREKDPCLGPCIHCSPLFLNWEPKKPNPVKSCHTCKHYACSLDKEPCESCHETAHHINWEPKDAEK